MMTCGGARRSDAPAEMVCEAVATAVGAAGASQSGIATSAEVAMMPMTRRQPNGLVERGRVGGKLVRQRRCDARKTRRAQPVSKPSHLIDRRAARRRVRAREAAGTSAAMAGQTARRLGWPAVRSPATRCWSHLVCLCGAVEAVQPAWLIRCLHAHGGAAARGLASCRTICVC